MGGAAHLVNFKGTDTIAALQFIKEYYGGNYGEGMSIPASEHSTITSWGQENEVFAFENMIKQYGDNPLYACVSDSYDIYKACSDLWGSELRDQVLAANGTLVVRPDSGDPETVVLKCLELLGEAFGVTVNDLGFKVLNPKVRVIQGDGVNYESIEEILRTMEIQGWSADNLAFGMGGGLLQKINRDTQKFAFKCCHAMVDLNAVDVFKDPITDKGKISKRGKLDLIRERGTLRTINVPSHWDKHPESVMYKVFEDGEIFEEYTFDAVRDNASL